MTCFRSGLKVVKTRGWMFRGVLLVVFFTLLSCSRQGDSLPVVSPSVAPSSTAEAVVPSTTTIPPTTIPPASTMGIVQIRVTGGPIYGLSFLLELPEGVVLEDAHLVGSAAGGMLQSHRTGNTVRFALIHSNGFDGV